jgi:hypothetical protein
MFPCHPRSIPSNAGFKLKLNQEENVNANVKAIAANILFYVILLPV